MSSEVSSTVTFGENDGVVMIFPEEDVAVSIPVTHVGGSLYRLEGIPLLVEGAGFRDVVEAEPIGDGKLRVRRVVESSGWRTFDFIVPPWKLDGDWGQALFRRLEELGGHWERVLGGLLFVCIPPGVDLDPTEWVEAFGSIERIR